MWILSIIVSIFLSACSKANESDDPIPSTPSIVDRFQSARARLASEFLENGWVVSRNLNGSPAHQGEGLIWTGLWLGASECSDVESEHMLQDMIRAQDGALIRFDPLPDEYKGGREVTLDGALGLYKGVAERVQRCPESRAAWYDVMTLHKNYMANSDGRLHPNASASLDAGFDYVLDRLLDSLSGGDPVNHDDRRRNSLTLGAAGWVATVNAKHEAGYRAHLVLLAFQTLQLAGENVDQGRDMICQASKGMDMPTLDDWCGRGDLIGWINQFQYDQWEFRHQRAAAWETPDGNGIRTPGLDLLVAIRAKYVVPGG